MLGPIMMLVWAWLWATHHRNTSTPYAGSFFLSLQEKKKIHKKNIKKKQNDEYD